MAPKQQGLCKFLMAEGLKCQHFHKNVSVWSPFWSTPTNLCNSWKYSFSLQRLKYININSTLCFKKMKITHTHMQRTCTTHSYTPLYWNKKKKLEEWRIWEEWSIHFQQTLVPFSRSQNMKGSVCWRMLFSVVHSVLCLHSADISHPNWSKWTATNRTQKL